MFLTLHDSHYKNVSFYLSNFGTTELYIEYFLPLKELMNIQHPLLCNLNKIAIAYSGSSRGTFVSRRMVDVTDFALGPNSFRFCL